MDEQRRKDSARWARDIIITVILLPAVLLWLQMTPPLIAICALCALALVKAWEHGRLSIVAAALIVAGSGLGWDYWYFSRIVATPAVQVVLPQVPPPTQPAAQPTTPQQPVPWVTKEEIDQQAKNGRILLVFSPAELIQMSIGHSDDTLDPYRENWVKVAGPFRELINHKVNGTNYDVLNIPAYYGPVFVGTIYAYFDPKKYAAQVRQLRPKDQVTAVCLFKDVVTRIEDKWTQRYFIGYRCDLL